MLFSTRATIFYVKKREHKFTIEFLIQNKVQFKYFLEPRYATDMIFQMPNRPCENIRENKFDFSGKHHLNDFKTIFLWHPIDL